MDRAIVAQIDARLSEIQRSHNVVIPLSVESGSRAWGFPSTDSDYDCRFMFVRSVEEYLSPWPRRDVIETPLDGLFDVNGWDLAKALKLLLKGNAVVIEWLTSPITYDSDQQFREEFLALAERVADRFLVGRHYLHLGERQRHTYFRDEKSIPQKKVFYAQRPAAALRWLRCHPTKAVAPMHFPTLMRDCEAPTELLEIVDALIVRKAETRELGSAPLPASVRDFIDSEFEFARGVFDRQVVAVSAEARTQAELFFSATARRLNDCVGKTR